MFPRISSFFFARQVPTAPNLCVPHVYRSQLPRRRIDRPKCISSAQSPLSPPLVFRQRSPVSDLGRLRELLVSRRKAADNEAVPPARLSLSVSLSEALEFSRILRMSAAATAATKSELKLGASPRSTFLQANPPRGRKDFVA